MSLISPQTELKLLVCMLETKDPQIRAYILAETAHDDYGSRYGSEVRQRVDNLLILGKLPLACVDLAQDPGLTQSTQDWIRVTPKQRQAAQTFTLSMIKELVHQLKLHRNNRVFHEAIKEINEKSTGAVDEKVIDDMTAIMERTLIKVGSGFNKQPITHIGKRQSHETAKKIMEQISTFTPLKFISTGIPGLDRLINGCERGTLLTISATRGGGKSALAMCMGVDQYQRSNHNVLYVSMEMTEDELWKRVAANISGVLHERIRFSKDLPGEKRAQLNAAWKAFHLHGHEKNCTFSIWDVNDPFFTPMKLESCVAPLMYDSIIIDYATLFYARNLNLWEMQMEYSRYLKSMAKRLNCLIILLTQMSEEDHVKYGRAIEENTDYWINWQYREDEEQETGDVWLKLAKARHTKPRKLLSKFRLDYMQIDTSEAVTGSATDDSSKEDKNTNTSGAWKTGGY